MTSGTSAIPGARGAGGVAVATGPAGTGRRRLDPTEAFHASIDWAGSYCAVITGPLDADALARALDELAARLPALRVRLERDEHGFVFRDDPAARPRFHILTPGASGAPGASVASGAIGQVGASGAIGQGGDGGGDVGSEMRRRLEPTEGLARLTLIPGDGRSHVVLALHHAVADAGAGLAVFTRLWQVYTAIVNGEPIPRVAGAGGPVSAERLLLARGFDDGRSVGAGLSREDEAAAVSAVLAARAGAFTLPPAVADRVRLSADTTDRLQARVGELDLSLNGLVCGVLLTAFRDELRPGPEPVRLVCGSPVDLRGWLSPPVDALAATNVVVGVEFAVVIGERADPVHVGRQATAALDAVVGAIRPEQMLLDPQRFSGAAVEAVDLMISNVGTVPAMPVPEPLRVVDFRGHPSSAVPGHLLHLVTVFDGRLSVDLISPPGLLRPDQRQRLVERIGRLLRTAARRRPVSPPSPPTVSAPTSPPVSPPAAAPVSPSTSPPKEQPR